MFFMKLEIKKKFGIFLLAHHKPWLIMSSLRSLGSQTFQEFELNIIYIKGDGMNVSKSQEYIEFNNLSKETSENNAMLSNDSSEIKKILSGLNFKFNIIELENDHGLDSGAWLKLIRDHTSIWKKYDYSLFLMEGFLFTNNKVLESLNLLFLKKNINYIATAYEKRIIPKSALDNSVTYSNSKLLEFQKKMKDKIFRAFCNSRKFENIFNSWSEDNILKKYPNGLIQHHVPLSSYTLSEIIRYILISFKHVRFFNPFQKLILIRRLNKVSLLPLKYFSKNIFTLINTTYHIEKSPFFYCCGCQHIYSKKYLINLDNKFKENNLYRILDYPFLASSFEIIWGMIPKWLGYEKWYFDGIHRPRKNFETDIREDSDVVRIFYYLNKYTKKNLKFRFESDLIKIRKNNQASIKLIEKLGEIFLQK